MNEEERVSTQTVDRMINGLYKKIKLFFNSVPGSNENVERFTIRRMSFKRFENDPTSIRSSWYIEEAAFTPDHHSIGQKLLITVWCKNSVKDSKLEFMRIYYDEPTTTTQRTMREYLWIFASRSDYSVTRSDVCISFKQALQLLTPEEMGDDTAVVSEII